MNNKTEIKYWVTWKSGIQHTKEGYASGWAKFTCRENAETWYDEKLAEGKKPQLWKEKIASTFEAMRPATTTQEDN